MSQRLPPTEEIASKSQRPEEKQKWNLGVLQHIATMANLDVRSYLAITSEALSRADALSEEWEMRQMVVTIDEHSSLESVLKRLDEIVRSQAQRARFSQRIELSLKGALFCIESQIAILRKVLSTYPQVNILSLDTAGISWLMGSSELNILIDQLGQSIAKSKIDRLILDPCFNQFLPLLRGAFSQGTLESLELYEIRDSQGNALVDELGRMLISSKLQHLVLSAIDLLPENQKILARALPLSLRTVRFDYFRKAFYDELAESFFGKGPSLEGLVSYGCTWSAQCERSLVNVAPSLRYLGLGCNDSSLAILAQDVLPHLNQLEQLNLLLDKIREETMERMVSALPISLTHLRLCGGNIQEGQLITLAHQLGRLSNLTVLEVFCGDVPNHAKLDFIRNIASLKSPVTRLHLLSDNDTTLTSSEIKEMADCIAQSSIHELKLFKDKSLPKKIQSAIDANTKKTTIERPSCSIM